MPVGFWFFAFLLLRSMIKFFTNEKSAAILLSCSIIFSRKVGGDIVLSVFVDLPLGIFLGFIQ